VPFGFQSGALLDGRSQSRNERLKSVATSLLDRFFCAFWISKRSFAGWTQSIQKKVTEKRGDKFT